MFLYARTLGAALRHRALTPSYAARSGALLASRTAVRGLQRTAHLADDVLHPRWRSATPAAPVWILAAPRSGTTLMHRLMSLDEERFTSLSLFDTILPSVSARRAVEHLGRLDAPHQKGRAWIDHLERRLFSGWEGIHRLGLGRAEEDEALFVHAGTSPAFLLLCPFVDRTTWDDFDALPAGQRARIMRFHRECMQRHLHATGPDRTLLLKNTLAAERLDSLLATYPDARIVHLVRHPFESLPSTLSMFHVVWRSLLPDLPKDGPHARALAHRIMGYYRRYAEVERQLPTGRVVTVRYRDLVADPAAAVERVYRELDLPMGSELRSRIEAEARRARRYRSGHQYRLEDFGLDPDAIYSELAELFSRYGFERRPTSLAVSRAVSTTSEGA